WKEFKEAAHAPSRPVVTLSPTLDEPMKPPTVRARAKSNAPVAMMPTVARSTRPSTLSSGAAEIMERDLADTINRPKKRGAMTFLGLGLGAAVVAVLAFANKKKDTPAPAPGVTPIAAPAPEPAKVAPPPVAPKQVTIKLTGMPEGAELALDGKPTQNPL